MSKLHMHKEKLRQVKKARFMIVYAVLYCVKGDKETQSHICIYTHTHTQQCLEEQTTNS